MAYQEDEYLLLSGLQHYVFCKRQWALIHIEQEWADNRLTAEGQLIHKNAHKDNFVEKRVDILTVRGLRIASPTLGIVGQCDVVEFTKLDESDAVTGAKIQGHRGLWQVCPVEYKRGKDKQDDSDILQLCCEAMALEEMLACHIPYGYLFYHEIRKRRKIEFPDELRSEVKNGLQEMHCYMQKRYIPKVKPERKCQSCSLKDFCLPKLQKEDSVADYYKKVFQEQSL